MSIEVFNGNEVFIVMKQRNEQLSDNIFYLLKILFIA